MIDVDDLMMMMMDIHSHDFTSISSIDSGTMFKWNWFPNQSAQKYRSNEITPCKHTHEPSHEPFGIIEKLL